MVEYETAPDEQTDQSRRSFLTRLWMAVGGLAVVGYASVVIAFLRPRQSSAWTGESDWIIEAGPVDKFERESVTAFVRGKFYLCRLKDGGFIALSRRCTHLGCTVPWVESQQAFACPCHASTFNIRGEVQNAPAPRPLDIYRVVIENNIVRVDTRSVIRRSGFRLEQVVYPKKV